MEAFVSGVIGAVVLSASAFLATQPRQAADAIENYYSRLAERKRTWPRLLAWQPRPGRVQSLVMAWSLIIAGFATGASFIAAGFLGR